MGIKQKTNSVAPLLTIVMNATQNAAADGIETNTVTVNLMSSDGTDIHYVPFADIDLTIISGSALFTDTKLSHTTVTTNVLGDATAYLSDIIEETVVVEAVLSTDSSVRAQISCTFGLATTYPAPTVDEAQGNIIDPDLNTNGVTVRIPAEATLAANDIVTVYWTGKTPGGSAEVTVTITTADAGKSLGVHIDPSVVSADAGEEVHISYIVKKATTGKSASSETAVYEIKSHSEVGTLKIMGARCSFYGYGRYKRQRLVALDSKTLAPVVATWSYTDEVPYKGDTFIDSKPDLLITVNAAGYDSVTVNISNIAGNGSYIDDGVGPAAFSAITCSGNIISWGDTDYGGKTPPQPFTDYDSLFVNAHAFVARSGSHNSLLAWGRSTDGGELPANIASRTDIIRVCGGFASMLLLAKSYPYIQTWGHIRDGDISPPSFIASADNIAMLSATSDAFAVVDRDGYVHSWGAADTGGDLPSHIADIDSVHDIAATERAFAVIFGDGQVSAWGDDSFGGDESALVGEKGIQQIFSTDSAFAALFNNGVIRAWGDALHGGQIPAEYANVTNVVDITSSFGAFVALKSDGTVISWGDSNRGGDSSSVQPELINVVAIYSTGNAFAALKNDGSVVTWGDARDGGNSSSVANELHDILAIYGNSRAFAALRYDNTVICWGDSESGGIATPDGLNNNISYLV